MTGFNEGIEAEPTREQLDAWLEANCGRGLPHGEAADIPAMLHGLAYVLRQIEGTSSYRPMIGQTVAATSSLRMALDHFARQALQPQPSEAEKVTDEVVAKAMQQAWDEICDDTGCHPLDITRNRRLLRFSPSHWADLTAKNIRAALAAAGGE